MMVPILVSFTKAQIEFMANEIKEGRYAKNQDVIRDALNRFIEARK